MLTTELGIDVSKLVNLEVVEGAIAFLKEFKKANLAELRKANSAEKAEAKTAEELAVKNKMEELDIVEGTEINVTFKGEEIIAVYVRMTEKRFVALVDGEKKTFLFTKFLGIVE